MDRLEGIEGVKSAIRNDGCAAKTTSILNASDSREPGFRAFCFVILLKYLFKQRRQRTVEPVRKLVLA